MVKIKALSLWQPWASLIAVGAKKYETRSWSTSYRGPLLICAAKKIIKLPFVGSWEFRQAARKALKIEGGQSFPQNHHGMAIAIVDLTNCIRTEMFKRGHEEFLREAVLGDFSSGRYAWELENVRAIKPFPVKGRQGLFEVEIDPCILEVPAV